MKAISKNTEVLIRSKHKVGGIHILTTMCASERAYKHLPNIVVYNGIQCGKADYSVESGIAVYRSGMNFAKQV